MIEKVESGEDIFYLYSAFLMLPLIILCIKYGQTPLSAFSGYDPMGWTERTIYVMNNQKPHPLDPPLRYIPHAMIATVLGLSAGSIYLFINTSIVSITYLIVPALVWTVLRERLNIRYASVGLTIIVIFAVDGSYGWNYRTGHFQNILVLIPAVLSLWLSLQSANSNDVKKAIIAGVVLVCAGLIQFTITAFAILTIAIVNLSKKGYKSLGCTVGIGLIGLPLVLLSPDVIDTTTRNWKTGRPSVFEPNLAIKPFVGTVVNPEIIASCVLLSLVVLAYFRSRRVGIQLLSLSILLVFFPLIFELVGLPYFEWATRSIRIVLLAILISMFWNGTRLFTLSEDWEYIHTVTAFVLIIGFCSVAAMVAPPVQ